MDKHSDKKLVLLLLNGFGVSFGWKGNAIAAANPKTFQELWCRHHHYFLDPTSHLEVDHQEIVDRHRQYLRFNSGEDLTTNFQLVEKAVKNETLLSDNNTKETLSYCKRHNTSLHFVALLSKKNLILQCKILDQILILARREGIFNFNLHIIADNSWESMSEFSKALTKIEVIFNRSRLGVIASITGGACLNDLTAKRPSIDKFIETLTRGQGKRFLSVHQMASQLKEYVPFLLEPVSILPSQNRSTNLDSFHSIIFSLIEPSCYSGLLSIFAQDKVDGKKQLSVLLLNNDQIGEQPVLSAISPPSSFDLFKTLRQGEILTAIVSEDYRSNDLSKLISQSRPNASYLLATSSDIGSYLAKFKKTNDQILAKSKELIASNKFGFILIDLPTIERASGSGSFAKTVAAIAGVDAFLSELESVILESGYDLLVTSLYGMAEKMSVEKITNTNIEICKTTKNPLPLILIGENWVSKKPASKFSFHEIARPVGEVSSLSPNIAKYFGLDTGDLKFKDFFN